MLSVLAVTSVVVGAGSFSALADVPEALTTPIDSEPAIVLADNAGAALASSDLLLSVDVGVDLWGQSELFGATLWQDESFESVLATDLSYQTSLTSENDHGLLLESAVIDLGPPLHIDYDSVSSTLSTAAPRGQTAGDGTGTNASIRTPWAGRLTVNESLSPVGVDPAVDAGGYFSISISTAPAPGAIALALLGLGLVGAFRAADRRS